jgi:curli production assembly/transport component CsgG
MKLFVLPMVLLLAGCSAMTSAPSVLESEPRVQPNPMAIDLATVPELDGPVITIGVYGFEDMTGQRAPADNFANLSSAVTQGADAWVIDALLSAGNGSWFEVVERSNLDDLVRERQLIRSTRENYLEGETTGEGGLDPLRFAGLLLAGGIVGYDSNVSTGGIGARSFGIGATTEYRIDTVTVAMRIISVSTGRVLASVAVEKSIASYRDSADVFRFLDLGTRALETEAGYSINEPTNYAVRSAIEAGVIELIYQGQRRGLWSFKEQ